MKKMNSAFSRSARTRVLRIESLEDRALLTVGVADLGSAAYASEESIEGIFEALNARQTDDVVPVVLSSETDAEADAATPWFSLCSPTLNPSADEQELLEQINRFRSDPAGELERIFSVYNNETLIARNSFVNDAITLNSYPKDSISTFLEEWRGLTTVAPLAFNSSLNSAAASHSAYMKSKNDISHRCSGEDPLSTRVVKAGFESGITLDDGAIAVSENIGGCFSANGPFSLASYILASFAVDWGVPSHDHRDALMNAAYSEAGISVLQTSKSIGPFISTCDFGSSVDGVRTDGAFLLGAIYDDLDEDLFYDAGEGLRSVDILIEKVDGEEVASTTITSWNSGGYQIFLANGSYRVTVSSEGFSSSVTKTATISDGVNVKLDFRTSDAGATAPIVDLNGDQDGIDLQIEYLEASTDPTELFSERNVVVSDSDSSYLYGAKIYFGARPDAADETIDVSLAGSQLSATYEDQGGTIAISGTGTLEEYEDVIASLSYFNAKEECDLTSERYLLISVYDGVYWSEEARLTIAVKPTNVPNLTVNEMVAYEGDEGAKIATFTVELDAPARVDVSFNFNVSAEGSAIEGADFTISKGDPIVIRAGETSATIDCYVNGNLDALKPEGLQAVDGGFEKPFTFFYLEIVDVENAVLTNENSLAKGTIFDDDSPIALGKTNSYAFTNPLSTEGGDRRYHFTLTPEKSGLFSWSAETAGLPEGSKISVRAESLESEPICVSTVTDAGGRAQWFADPSVEYWVTLESSDDLQLITARLLEVTDEKIALVDPILEEAESDVVGLGWGADGPNLALGDWIWNLSDDYWRDARVKTERPDVVLETALPPQSNSTVESNDDGFVLDVDGYGAFYATGFSSISYDGNDDNEEIKLVGTEGYDYLFYADGSGYFRTSLGELYRFNKVNKVVVDGGGGDDIAFIQDSPHNDRLETTNGSLSLYGGGYELTATNFSTSRVVFNRGGEDEYYATDSGDDVVVNLTDGSSIFSGTYAVDDDTDDGESSEGTGQQDTNDSRREYVRTVQGAEKTIIAPEEYVGAAILSGEYANGALFNVAVGNLVAFDAGASRETFVSKAKDLTINGLYAYANERVSLALPSEYVHVVEGDVVTITDLSTGWVLKAPTWKYYSIVNETGDNTQSVSSASDLSVALLDAAVIDAFEYFQVDEIDVASDYLDEVADAFLIDSERSCSDRKELRDYALDAFFNAANDFDAFEILEKLRARK